MSDLLCSTTVRIPAADSPAVQVCADDRVLTLAESALVANVSIATFRRLIEADDGPVITQISPRRIGIRVRHLREWLDGRAERRGAA